MPPRPLALSEQTSQVEGTSWQGGSFDMEHEGRLLEMGALGGVEFQARRKIHLVLANGGAKAEGHTTHEPLDEWPSVPRQQPMGWGLGKKRGPRTYVLSLASLLLLTFGLVACASEGASGKKDRSTSGGDSDTTPGDSVPIDAELELKEGKAFRAPDEVLSSAHGLGSALLDASFDKSGNLWAVSRSRLVLRRKGSESFESFGSADGLKDEEMLSVGGGLGNTAFVGFMGSGDSLDDPEWMLDSGGVAKVSLRSSGISVKHFNLRAPPGLYPAYPEGRNKLRTCFRVYPTKNGRYQGDAWFGCNHGAGMVTANEMVWEHHHPSFCEWDPVRRDCTIRTGDVGAVASTPNGDMWFGGTYGVMKVEYDNGDRGNFWGPEPVRNTSLWQEPLEPNGFGSEDIVALAVASDDTLWAASSHSGLARRHDDASVEIYQKKDGLPSNHLSDLALDPDNGLWIASEDQGLFRLDLKTGTWQRAWNSGALVRRVVVERIDGGTFVVAVAGGEILIWRL